MASLCSHRWINTSVLHWKWKIVHDIDWDCMREIVHHDLNLDMLSTVQCCLKGSVFFLKMPANYIRILSSVLIKMLLSNLLICSGWSTEVTFHRVTDQTLYTGCTGTPNIFHLGPLSHNVGAPNMFQSNAILGVGGLGQSWLAKGHRSEHGHHSNSHWHVWETLFIPDHPSIGLVKENYKMSISYYQNDGSSELTNKHV